MIEQKEKPNLVMTEAQIPLISIILVSLNSRKTIEQTILSIINIDYPKTEFIIIDGESSDGTTEIINKYRQYIDQVVVEKDHGIYDAMNKGTKIARGDYFYFVGSDDVLVNSWHRLIGKLKSQNTVYYCNVYFPVSNKIYAGKFGKLKRMIRNICHQAIFYPRSIFDRYQYSDKYPMQSDFHLNILINSDPDYNFKYINLLTAIFSERGISTTKTDSNFKKDHLEIIKKHNPFFLFLFCFIALSISRWISKIRKSGKINIK